MACDCLTTAEEQLPRHRIDTAFLIVDGDLVCRPRIALVRKDTGRRESRAAEPTSIAPTYCPFCGEAY